MIDAVLSALRRMKARIAAEEPGCVQYQVSRARTAANQLLLYEVYSDDSALEAHRSTPHFRAIIEGEVIPMLERRDREFFDVEIR
jgi:quinol monooxygenase YgiN